MAWGEPVFVIPQNGDYYLEYNNGLPATSQPLTNRPAATRGLTVKADGTVVPVE